MSHLYLYQSDAELDPQAPTPPPSPAPSPKPSLPPSPSPTKVRLTVRSIDPHDSRLKNVHLTLPICFSLRTKTKPTGTDPSSVSVADSVSDTCTESIPYPQSDRIAFGRCSAAGNLCQVPPQLPRWNIRLSGWVVRHDHCRHHYQLRQYRYLGPWMA